MGNLGERIVTKLCRNCAKIVAKHSQMGNTTDHYIENLKNN